jgi:hypothetical protein
MHFEQATRAARLHELARAMHQLPAPLLTAYLAASYRHLRHCGGLRPVPPHITHIKASTDRTPLRKKARSCNKKAARSGMDIAR